MNWRVAAGCAAVGALISLIAGLAGGNPFGVILLRLVLSAAVFAGIGALLLLLLRRFVPELLSRAAPAAPPGPGGAEARSGVDIVIEGDIPQDGMTLLDEGAPAAAEAPTGLPKSDGPVVEEATAAEAAPGPETEEGLSPLPGSQAESAPWEPSGRELDSLETLAEPERGQSGEAPRSLREAAREQAERAVAGQDPADLAKAVRTFMRRDQEG